MNPWRAGYADSILGRECKCPVSGFMASQKYLMGYFYGDSVREPQANDKREAVQ